MRKIKKLSKDLIKKIAAGEVVERPSSVVKELIENSVDAKATEIVIEVQQSGKKLISIKDDGEGIDVDDKNGIFEQHATSKLDNIEDLFNIQNYGFRGEALASIASVSEKVIVNTKTKTQDGFKVVYQDGDLRTHKVDESFATSGTKIDVLNLFANVPVRKKFLKSDATEYKNIIQTFIELALANSNIHFKFVSDGKDVYNLPKTDQIINRIADIFGTKTAKSLIPLSVDNQSYQIRAYITSPEFANKSTDLQIILINNRPVKDKIIQASVSKAYSLFIHKELKPNYIIFIHIDPTYIDVNIHPRKQEVRYENSEEIFRTMYNAIVNTINSHQSKNLIKPKEQITTYVETEPQINEEKTYPSINTHLKNYATNQSGLRQQMPSKNKTSINRAIEFTRMLFDSNQSKSEQNTTINDNDTFYKDSNSFFPYQNINPIQFFLTYIAFEFENEIIFIDQHAAAEKILFEKLLNEYENGIENQELLIPEIIELEEQDKNILFEKQKEIEISGIRFEDFGAGAIKVTHHPQITKDFRSQDFFAEILNDDIQLLNSDQTAISKLNIPKHVYKYLAITACHGSIRAGQVLEKYEMKNLIFELEKLNFPHQCPHGRPIRYILQKNELLKNFNRII